MKDEDKITTAEMPMKDIYAAPGEEFGAKQPAAAANPAPPEQGATPRPWTIQQLNHVDGELWLQIGFFDKGGREIGPICELVGGAVKIYRPVAEFQHLVAPDDEVRANAALIVKAVNAHDALVDSAKLAVTVLRDSEADEWAKSHAIAALNKAIALTETKETQ